MAEIAEKRPVRILLLEDSALDAELAVERLRRSSLEPDVTQVSDRAGFERALAVGGYDLVLADYALPDFDGMAALQLSRERIPQVPFIFISGRVGEEVAIDTLQRGATDYVLKHRMERLVPAVMRALRESDEHARRVQAQAAFRQSEMRFRSVIDAVPQMIWVASSSGRIVYANKRWEEFTASALDSWCDPRFIHPEDYAHLSAAWQVALERDQAFTREVRFLQRSTREYRWQLLRMLPLELDPELPPDAAPTWLGSATDLQDQKRNEEALRTADKLAVTGRLAAAIAHEINNPLESLTNLIFLVRLESADNERALNYLEMTENELARISAITKQTLQFYRDPLMPVRVDVGELIDEVVRLFAGRFSSKQIRVACNIDSGLVVEAIKGEIRQVLINLINNAIDAVGTSGHIDVEASHTMLRDQPGVRIMIHDDGSGIAPEQKDLLFQPFFSTKGQHGTGLGLWVSKGIVEKHGGTLQLGTSRTNGQARTTARFELPVKAAPELMLDDAASRES